jgi:pyruvate dehydrogenase E1 component beta subunit
MAILGAAMGAAMTGLRPIAEIMFSDFLAVCWDIVANEIAKSRYMTNGQVSVPLVIRTANGGGSRFGAQHSQSVENWAMAIPGIKVVAPAFPADVKGLLAASIRDEDPVLFFEQKSLYSFKGEVPDGAYTIPFGEASLVREGEHVTVVALARMVPFAEKAVDALAKEGITCDLIDPRTTSPMDEDTILESVENTGRLVVVDESNPRCSVASDIAGMVAARGFHSLKAPVQLVTAPHTPVPFARELERAYVPSPTRIEAAIRAVMKD